MATMTIPIVSIVVPFLGLPFRILNAKSVKPKKGTTMETIGNHGKGGTRRIGASDAAAVLGRIP